MAKEIRPAFPAWPPFALFAAAAAYLALRWDSIPRRWPTHWGVTGEPNDWAERTPTGVFGPLVVGAAIALFVESLLWMLPRSRDASEPLQPIRDARKYFMRIMTFAVALVLTLVAVVLPLGPSLPIAAIVVIALVFPGIATALGARRISAALHDVRRAGHADKVEGYRGLHYANPNDSRLWVPKLTGVGTTINFAHPWAWPVMILLTGLPIAIVVVILVVTRP
ncbi:MAG TPA: DUF5808 domain-containing protein [Polyangiaceae bacterium]|jgi:uncharacterized membrane protein